MRTDPVVIFICLLILGCYTGCGTDIAGSGSQTTNGVTVEAKSNSIIIKADSGLKAIVYSSDYVMSGYSNSVTMNNAEGRFDSLSDGWYSIIVKSNTGRAVIFQDVPVNSIQEFRKTGILQTTGTVSGSIYKTGLSPCLVYIKGTPFSCITFDGIFKLDSIPVSTYKLIVNYKYSVVDSIPDDNLEDEYLVRIDEENPHQVLNIEQ